MSRILALLILALSVSVAGADGKNWLPCTRGCRWSVADQRYYDEPPVGFIYDGTPTQPVIIDDLIPREWPSGEKAILCRPIGPEVVWSARAVICTTNRRTGRDEYTMTCGTKGLGQLYASEASCLAGNPKAGEQISLDPPGVYTNNQSTVVVQSISCVARQVQP